MLLIYLLLNKKPKWTSCKCANSIIFTRNSKIMQTYSGSQICTHTSKTQLLHKWEIHKNTVELTCTQILCYNITYMKTLYSAERIVMCQSHLSSYSFVFVSAISFFPQINIYSFLIFILYINFFCRFFERCVWKQSSYLWRFKAKHWNGGFKPKSTNIRKWNNKYLEQIQTCTYWLEETTVNISKVKIHI